MKNLKKLVSVVLTLALLISTMATSVIASDYADVEKTSSYFEAIDILSGLKILEGDELGNFNPGADIKRSEVTAVLARALGQENAALGTTGYSSFADVSADHWAVGYINWAAQQGIVNGRDAQTFDPDAPVKYQEVTKMLVEALGYGPLATKRGGYPTGHMVIASSNAITSGISLAGDANAPREVVAQLVYNALDVPLMDASIITASGDDEYAIYNGKGDNERRTVLSYYLEIAKVKAQVITTTKGAVGYYNVNDTWRDAASKPIEIDKGDEEETEIYINTLVGFGSLNDNGNYNGFEYYEGDYNEGEKVTAYSGGTDADDLLGYNVIAYVGKDDNDDDRIYAITPDTKESDILDVKDWVDSATDAGDIYEVEYYVDGDTSDDAEEIEVAEEASVIVNGSPAGAANALDADYAGTEDFETLLTEASNVVFMGDADDDVYSYVFVTKYIYDMVAEVDTEEEIIEGELSSYDLYENANAGNFRYSIILDGEEIGLEDLQENDVLNMVWQNYVDPSKSAYVDIYVSRDTVEGTVTESSGSVAEGYEYTIDGTQYEVYDDSEVSLALGDEGTFYLTIDGKIFDMIVTSASKDYAFITRIDSSAEFGVDTYYVEMVTADGIIADYTVASTFKLTTFANGVKSSTSYKRSDGSQDAVFGSAGLIGKYVKDQATEDAATATIEKRFVTYTLNSNSEISGMTIAQATGSDKNKSSVFDLNEVDGANYNPSTGKLGAYYYGDETKIFVAPASGSASKWNISEDDVSVINISSLDEDKEGGYGAYIFNTDSSKNFGAAVLTEDVSPSGVKNALAVVTGLTSGTNMAGEEADGIAIIQSGEAKTVYAGEDMDSANSTVFSGLAKGDVVYFSIDGAGDIKKIVKVYDASSKAMTATYDATAEIGFVYGYVEAAKSNYVTVSDGDEDNGVDYSFAKDDNSTFALIDENKAGTKSYVSVISSLKASTNSKSYNVVLKINEDEEVVDAIEILLDEDDEYDSADYDYRLDWDATEESDSSAE